VLWWKGGEVPDVALAFYGAPGALLGVVAVAQGSPGLTLGRQCP
jgi:hypothetical protein